MIMINSMKRNKIFSFILCSLTLGFLFFIFYYDTSTELRHQEELDISADIIAESIWIVYMPASKLYIESISGERRYKSVAISSPTGQLILEVKTDLEKTIDQLFFSLHLVRTNSLNSKIIYQGQNIGNISVEVFNFSIYVYCYVFILLILMLLVSWFSLQVFQAKNVLEQRVRDRTVKLTELNEKYRLEINERKQAEDSLKANIEKRKQSEKMRDMYVNQLEAQRVELERFTYTVSHDLKSPLITIMGFLGMLKKDAEDGNIERLQSDINRISAAAAKMGNLLEDLLNLSRIGRIANEPVDVALDKLAHEVAESLHGSITEGGVSLEIESGMPIVRGDHIRLHEVLQNLIENAIKFMGDQTHPSIKIGSRINKGETICYVRDNGQGIAPVYADKIFGLFEQLDGHTDGTGIGLALVKRIIEYHGGRVWVESEGLGCGSEFCFSIPLKGES